MEYKFREKYSCDFIININGRTRTFSEDTLPKLKRMREMFVGHHDLVEIANDLDEDEIFMRFVCGKVYDVLEWTLEYFEVPVFKADMSILYKGSSIAEYTLEMACTNTSKIKVYENITGEYSYINNDEKFMENFTQLIMDNHQDIREV